MYKKIVTIGVLVSFLTGVLPVFPPKRAEAAVPVIETNAPLIAANLQTAGATFSDLTQNLYTWARTFVISTLRKQLLDVMVDQIIAYIQGGDKPQFVTDWKGFLEDAGQAAAGSFIQEIGLGFLCQPFSLSVQIALLPVKKFSQRAQCTLDQIVGNINAFRQDFRNGGWIGFSASWEPQNNFFGALLMALEEKQSRQEKASGAAALEALAGGGFKSARDKNGNIVTPGSTLGAATAKAVTADIDYILSAEQLTDYASAIASALINRVLTEGLATVQTAISGDSNTEDQYNNLIQNNFNFNKSSLLNSVNMTLLPRQDSAALIDSMIQKLTKYKADLQKLSNDFTATGKTICTPSGFGQQSVNVDQTKQEITAEIAEVDALLAQLQQDKLENNAIVFALLDAVDRINQLTNDNAGLNELTNINNEIYPILNPPEASNFKSAIEALNETVNKDITDTLAIYNARLIICQTAN